MFPTLMALPGDQYHGIGDLPKMTAGDFLALTFENTGRVVFRVTGVILEREQVWIQRLDVEDTGT